MKQFAVLFLSIGLVATLTAARFEDKKDEKKEEKKVEKKEDKKPADVSPDLKKLSGTFAVTTFEENGKKSGEDELKKMKVTQTGSAWKYWYNDEVTTGEDKVDPSKKPMEIDSTYTNGRQKDKTVKGIYEVDAGTVKYCYAEPGKDRPKAFESKSDSGHTLMILKRIKEEVKKKDEPKKEEKKKDEPKKEEKKDEEKKKE